MKEIHDSFKYSHSGLGGGAAVIIAIIVAYFTAGAVSGLVASSASTAGLLTAGGGVWAAGTGASLSGIGWANAVVTAGLTGMASNAAVSTINNRGNIGAVLKDVTSNEAMRGYVVAGVTAGLTTGVFDGWTNTETGTSTALPNSGAVTTVGGLNTWGGVGRFTGNQLLQNGTSTLVDRALGGDSKFSDALRTSLANAFAAAGFNWVGDKTSVYEWDWKNGSLPKIGLHALMGARSRGCRWRLQDRCLGGRLERSHRRQARRRLWPYGLGREKALACYELASTGRFGGGCSGRRRKEFADWSLGSCYCD